MFFWVGSRARHAKLISYRLADCVGVGEMIVFTVCYYSNLRVHILTVFLSLTSRKQAIAILQFLSWEDDNLILLSDGSNNNLWRRGCIGD